MRQATARKQDSKPKTGNTIRDSPKELMVEGVEGKRKRNNRFTSKEVDYIIRRRNELEAEGKKDGQIAKAIAQEIQRSQGSVSYKIRQLIKEEKLEKNSNKRECRNYTSEDEAYIIKRRRELEAKGKKDKQIARIIAKEKQWKTKSVSEKIRMLLKARKLKDNTNKKSNLTLIEDEYIIRRRNELATEGMNDGQIARIIAKGKNWRIRSVEYKIDRFIKKGKLKENKNRRVVKKFTSKHEKYLIKRRKDLEDEGKNDGQIARIIAKEKQWKLSSISNKIRLLIKTGKVRENRNKTKRRDYTFEDETYIIRKRKDLEDEGKNDGQIARIIAKEKQWNEDSSKRKIWNLVKAGKLKENKNKLNQCKFTQEDEEYIIKRRKQLEAIGKNDNQIAKTIAEENRWSALSTYQKIRKLIKAEKLQDNRNKFSYLSQPTAEGLLSGLTQAADAMEQFGDSG
jgi:hypothetical protein